MTDTPDKPNALDVNPLATYTLDELSSEIMRRTRGAFIVVELEPTNDGPNDGAPLGTWYYPSSTHALGLIDIGRHMLHAQLFCRNHPQQFPPSD
jgi:hypothetical protein